MNELSLFTGAGGGLLGTKLLGWNCIGYVEFNRYCQQVIRARIDDGILDVAPIFTDVREFIESGAVDQYRGFVDVVTAGFPCQPFSVAGKRKGNDDDRNMWPATIEIVRRVKPRYCFFENVPGLLSAGCGDMASGSNELAGGYFGTILRDLAESGFDVRWRVLSAAEVGAPHKRDRLWIVANAKEYGGKRKPREFQKENEQQAPERQEKRIRELVNASEGSSSVGNPKHAGQSAAEITGSTTQGNDSSKAGQEQTGELAGSSVEQSDLANPTFERVEGCRSVGQQEPQTHAGEKLSGCNSARGGAGDWPPEPDVGRVVSNGVAHRVDRLKAIGNGQVPRVVATAWRLLTEC